MRFIGMILFSIIAAALFVLFFIWNPALNFGDNFSAIFSRSTLSSIWPMLLIAWAGTFFLMWGIRISIGAKRRSRRDRD